MFVETQDIALNRERQEICVAACSLRIAIDCNVLHFREINPRNIRALYAALRQRLNALHFVFHNTILKRAYMDFFQRFKIRAQLVQVTKQYRTTRVP